MTIYYIEFAERATEMQISRISNTRPPSGDALEVDSTEGDIGPLRSSLKITIPHNYCRHLISNARLLGAPLKVGLVFFNDLLGKPRSIDGGR